MYFRLASRSSKGGITVAGGLRYGIGREMPPGMQELYGVKLAGEMAKVPPAAGADEPESVAGGQEKMPYCGDAPEREDLPGCPFCGSENLLIDRDSGGWYVECNGCLAEGPRAETQAEAERRWASRE